MEKKYEKNGVSSVSILLSTLQKWAKPKTKKRCMY